LIDSFLAQVKTVDRQVKLKLILLDTNDIITISEEQVVHPVALRIGNTITIRLPSTNRHDSRSGLAALINPHDEKQAIIKQIYDNSIYTVVFNDGDEKSLRRSSLCLQGVRLYQQKHLKDIPTPSSSSTISPDSNDLTSVVAIRRNGNNNPHVFPALILKRKSLADYIWIKSFLDGREYIVHKHDDVQPYKNNSDIQSLCRLTSKQATKACEKFIKHNQIPTIWQKKKKKQVNNDYDEANNINDKDLNTCESDAEESDEDTIEEKDSFVAQLFAFMDDRG
jgi:Ras-related protein Rab-1A